MILATISETRNFNPRSNPFQIFAKMFSSFSPNTQRSLHSHVFDYVIHQAINRYVRIYQQGKIIRSKQIYTGLKYIIIMLFILEYVETEVRICTRCMFLNAIGPDLTFLQTGTTEKSVSTLRSIRSQVISVSYNLWSIILFT